MERLLHHVVFHMVLQAKPHIVRQRLPGGAKCLLHPFFQHGDLLLKAAESSHQLRRHTAASFPYTRQSAAQCRALASVPLPRRHGGGGGLFQDSVTLTAHCAVKLLSP